MMLVLSVILVMFLGLSVVVLTGALCSLCMDFYEDFYGDLEKEQGD